MRLLGAQFAALVAETGYDVVEAPRYNTGGRGGAGGKTDALDALRIAQAAVPLTDTQLRHPRDGQGERAALAVLTTARDAMTTERAGKVQSLTALLRQWNLGIDARLPLTGQQIIAVSRWQERTETLAVAAARCEAIRLATRILALAAELKANKAQIKTLVQTSPAAGLLAITGIGPVTAAVILTVWSHPGRIHSEAAFAAIAGVNPIPASSGNTTRHRLNRSGDRRLNQALHMAAITRMRTDPETKKYVEKRRAQGRTDREIRRCIKRYLARKIYRHLNSATTESTT